MHKQKGVTLSGFIMWAVILIFVALLGFKIGPPYAEFFTIKKQLQAIGNDASAHNWQRRDIEDAFMKRSMIENIDVVTPKDLAITKEGNGFLITVEYTVCRPIVSNLRACMDFAASSKP